jgi:uncharacterized protein YggE
MKSNGTRYRTVTLGALALLALVISGCGILTAADTDDDSAASLRESISVSGFGKATGVPDMAVVQFAVETEAGDIADAIDESNRTIDSIRAALLGMGIAETDLQSTSFNVWPEDEFDRQTGQPTGVRTYHVDSTLSATLRDINRVSEMIKTGLDAGATNIWGLTFGIDDTAALEAEARAQALQDADARAAQLAESIGVSLGEPIAVSELAGGGIVPFAAEFASIRGLGGGGGGGPPISLGELTVNVQVDVMYTVEESGN